MAFVSWYVQPLAAGKDAPAPLWYIQYGLEGVNLWQAGQRPTRTEHGCARCGQTIPKGTLLAKPLCPPNAPIRSYRICLDCISLTEEEVYGRRSGQCTQH